MGTKIIFIYFWQRQFVFIIYHITGQGSINSGRFLALYQSFEKAD
jgi:hypothetical protein